MALEVFAQQEPKNCTQIAEAQNLIKASLFNLIVLSQDPERVSHCQELINTITKKFPCRIIFVSADATTQSDFIRTTKTLKTIGEGSNCVFCDQITIEASVTQFAKIPFVLLPHIQPDLPTYILVCGDPTQDQQILPHIKKYAIRILFDTETFDTFNHFSAHILSYSEANKESSVIDLHWARTKAWRESIAQVFNSQETLSQLAKSKMIQITYAAIPTTHVKRQDIQAVYLQAWLAAKLKWTLLSVEKDGNVLRISYKYEHTSLTVVLMPKDTDILPTGSIYSFEVMTHDDYHFLLSHENDGKLVKVHASNPERCEMPYTLFLSNYQNGPNFVSEIFYQLPSNHYHAMLQALTHQMWSTV